MPSSELDTVFDNFFSTISLCLLDLWLRLGLTIAAIDGDLDHNTLSYAYEEEPWVERIDLLGPEARRNLLDFLTPEYQQPIVLIDSPANFNQQYPLLLKPRYCSDGWGAYGRHLPLESHEIGKRKTQRIERKHLNLRTRIKRLTRKTICFFKTEEMHDLVINLFINRYEFGLKI